MTNVPARLWWAEATSAERERMFGLLADLAVPAALVAFGELPELTEGNDEASMALLMRRLAELEGVLQAFVTGAQAVEFPLGVLAQALEGRGEQEGAGRPL